MDRLDVVEQVLRLPELSLVDLSRDGAWAVIVSNLTGSYQLWSFKLADKTVVQVSHGDQRVTYARVSPDLKNVFFLRDFDGKERHQLFVTSIEGGEKEMQLSDFKDLRLFDFACSPQGRKIALTGSTSESNYLWVFDVYEGRLEPVFKSGGWIFSPSYSESGDVLAFSANTTGTPRSSEIVVIDFQSGATSVYTPKPGSENTIPKWHPQAMRILFKTNAAGPYDLAIYDIDSSSFTTMGLSKYGVDFTDFGWLSDGGVFWFVARRNGRSKLYVRKDGGDVAEVETPVGTITGIEVDRTGSFAVFSWSSLSRPPVLYRVDIKSGKLHLLYEPAQLRGLPLGKAEFISYRSFDGLEVPGFLLLAEGKKEPKPCVVWVHGGPWWEVGDEWNAPVQALCAAGFHVLCPNFRGSTGYGADFERLNIGDPGGGDMQDVLHGVKYLYELGLVDDERVGVAGASYGGFMTFLTMTKNPDVWKAGAAIVGVTDWMEDYELSDAAFRNFTEQLLGKPEEKPELFRDRSPINFVHQTKAPILVWHRANDSRCPLQPVEKFVKKLKQLGKPHEFYVVEGEGHGVQRLENFVKQYRTVADFFLRYL
ncbi:MAG: S9 family peptidase [Candidatus Caldarchaeum sp.]